MKLRNVTIRDLGDSRREKEIDRGTLMRESQREEDRRGESVGGRTGGRGGLHCDQRSGGWTDGGS